MEQVYQADACSCFARTIAAAYLNRLRSRTPLDKVRRCSLRTLSLLLTLAQMQLLTGCALIFRPEYPSQLPPLLSGEVNSGLCPDITGHYSDKGKVLTPKGETAGEVSLSQLLHNDDPCFAQADSVVVLGPKQVLVPGYEAQEMFEIKSLKNGQPFATWRQPLFKLGVTIDSRQSYNCQRGFVEILRYVSYGGIYFTAVWENHDYLWLRQAIDGSLIVLHKDCSLGAIVVVPFATERDLWYRFPPVPEGIPYEMNRPPALIPIKTNGSIVVKMQAQKFPDDGLLASVKVNDLRTPGVAASEREWSFGVKDTIVFDPPEPELVKNLLEAELTKLLREKGVRLQQEYVCDIIEFGANTKPTLLYFEITGNVRLVLKHNGKQYYLSGAHTEKDFIWPGVNLIKKVVDESFKQITAELKHIF